MPYSSHLTTRTARERYTRGLLPTMIAYTQDADTAYLVMVAFCPASRTGAEIEAAMNLAIGKPPGDAGADEETRGRETFRWFPHDRLADMLGGMKLGTDAQRAKLARREAAGVARAVWIDDAGRVDLFRIEMGDDFARALLAARRDLVHHTRLEEAGLDLDDLSKRSRAFAVGSSRDPNQYLPDPLPQGWVVETDRSDAAQDILVDGSTRVSVSVLTLEGRQRVFALCSCADEDREPRDAEIRRVVDHLRNAGTFDEVELDAEGRALLVPPGTRVFAATTRLAPDE